MRSADGNTDTDKRVVAVVGGLTVAVGLLVLVTSTIVCAGFVVVLALRQGGETLMRFFPGAEPSLFALHAVLYGVRAIASAVLALGGVRIMDRAPSARRLTMGACSARVGVSVVEFFAADLSTLRFVAWSAVPVLLEAFFLSPRFRPAFSREKSD